MKKIKMFLTALLWIPAIFLVEIPLILLGLIVVPMLAYTKKWRAHSECDHDLAIPYAWKYKWAYIWGNDEDGILGPFYTPWPGTSLARWIAKAQKWGFKKRAVSWSAFRNPAANLRYTKWGVELDEDRILWYGNSMNPWEDFKYFGGNHWCLARQGAKSGLWIVCQVEEDKYFLLRIGWGVHPDIVRDKDRLQGVKMQIGLRKFSNSRSEFAA